MSIKYVNFFLIAVSCFTKTRVAKSLNSSFPQKTCELFDIGSVAGRCFSPFIGRQVAAGETEHKNVIPDGKGLKIFDNLLVNTFSINTIVLNESIVKCISLNI